jgi:hypothetical protein
MRSAGECALRSETIDSPNILAYTLANVQTVDRKLIGGNCMEGPLRGIIAGIAAWKLGGGCISTVLIFILVYYFLGKSC